MANLVTYPLDNTDYSADDAALFHSTRTTGIFAGDDFSYSLTGSDNTVKLDPGLGWMRLTRFKGQVVALKETAYVDMGLPDSVYPRIDHVILQFNANSNDTQVVVKNGVASSNPQPPQRSTTEALYEIHLLQARREPGATALTPADITDLRLDVNYCGLMADEVTRIDTAAINAQITALINQLREDIAAVKAGTSFVMKSGDTMTGPLNIPDPEESTHAANRGYVDSKKFSARFVIGTEWTGTSAPYTQTIVIEGILESDYPNLWLLASSDKDIRTQQREALDLITDANTFDGYITFICDEERPGIEIPVYIEVSR